LEKHLRARFRLRGHRLDFDWRANPEQSRITFFEAFSRANPLPGQYRLTPAEIDAVCAGELARTPRPRFKIVYIGGHKVRLPAAIGAAPDSSPAELEKFFREMGF
jgi:hypothetical protein